MSGVIAAVLIVFAIGILVLSLAAGAVLFSRERAEALRVIEADVQAIVGQMGPTVPPQPIYHWPSPLTNRLDRHDTYVWLNFGIWLVSWNMLVTPATTSGNLALLSASTQFALALCLLVGTSMVLAGSALGFRMGRFVIARRVRENIVSPLLGDDVRVPYVLSFFGLLSISVSMAFYTWTIVMSAPTRLLGTLGGGLGLAIIGMCLTLGGRLLVQLNGYSKARDSLLAKAAARVQQRLRDEPE